MRSQLLRCIYYVTLDHFVTIPQGLISDLSNHGIKIFQVPYNSIDKFLPPKNLTVQSCLILCDIPELAKAFLDSEYNVVGVIHNDNKDKHFTGIPYLVEDFEELSWTDFLRFWQRYMDIPWTITHTERCTIREMCPDDLNDLYDMYSDKRICQYTEDLFENRMQELQYIKTYVKNMYHFYNYGTWIIEDTQSGNMIGRAGFSLRPGFEDPELGFVINPKYWRHGYASEVCTHLLDYGKNELGFTRVHAFVMPENEASVHLLEKLGFHSCGRYTIADIIHDRCVLDL